MSLIGLCCIAVIAVWTAPDPEYTIETAYGDRFTVRCDTFLHKNLLYCAEGDGKLYMQLRTEPEPEDIVCVCDTSELRAYTVDGCFIYNAGDGFRLFEGIDGSTEEIARLVRTKLLSDYMIFKNNTKYFLDDPLYREETREMLTKLVSGSSDGLYGYGFVPDAEDAAPIREKAGDFLL